MEYGVLPDLMIFFCSRSAVVEAVVGVSTSVREALIVFCSKKSVVKMEGRMRDWRRKMRGKKYERETSWSGVEEDKDVHFEDLKSFFVCCREELYGINPLMDFLYIN